MCEDAREKWSQLEYEKLREEILAFYGIIQTSMRIFIPVAIAVWTVPYLLKRPSDQVLWTLSAAGAGIVVFTLIQSMFWNVHAVRKIGTYLKERVEPNSHGGLGWEAWSYDRDLAESNVPSEESLLALALLSLNTLGAVAVGIMTSSRADSYSWAYPLLGTLIPTLLSIPFTKRLLSWGRERRKLEEEVRKSSGGPRPRAPKHTNGERPAGTGP